MRTLKHSFNVAGEMHMLYRKTHFYRLLKIEPCVLVDPYRLCFIIILRTFKSIQFFVYLLSVSSQSILKRMQINLCFNVQREMDLLLHPCTPILCQHKVQDWNPFADRHPDRVLWDLCRVPGQPGQRGTQLPVQNRLNPLQIYNNSNIWKKSSRYTALKSTCYILEMKWPVFLL